jgi:hypothetical protein
VIEPLLLRQFLTSGPRTMGGNGQIIEDTENGAVNENVGGSESPFTLPAEEQKQIAKTLGEVTIRLGRLDEALRYLRAAQKLETAPALRKEVTNKIAHVSAQLRRRQLNATRQPILHEALEQDRLVRPRLLARSTSAKEGVEGGTKQ